MTSPKVGHNIREKINDDSTHDPSYYGIKVQLSTDKGTTHVSILAENGDAVSATHSINAWWVRIGFAFTCMLKHPDGYAHAHEGIFTCTYYKFSCTKGHLHVNARARRNGFVLRHVFRGLWFQHYDNWFADVIIGGKRTLGGGLVFVSPPLM